MSDQRLVDIINHHVLGKISELCRMRAEEDSEAIAQAISEEYIRRDEVYRLLNDTLDDIYTDVQKGLRGLNERNAEEI